MQPHFQIVQGIIFKVGAAPFINGCPNFKLKVGAAPFINGADLKLRHNIYIVHM